MSTLPYSAIGLTIGLMSGGKMYVKQGAIIFVGGGPLNLARMFGKTTLGVTLGNVVFIRSKEVYHKQREVVAHELAHVKQYRTYGAMFGPIYALQVASSGYENSPFEKQAYNVQENYNNEWESQGKKEGAPPPPLPGPYTNENITGIDQLTNLENLLVVNLVGGI